MVQIGEIGKKIKFYAVLPMGEMIFTIGKMGKSGGFAGRCWWLGRAVRFLGAFLFFCQVFAMHCRAGIKLK